MSMTRDEKVLSPISTRNRCCYTQDSFLLSPTYLCIWLFICILYIFYNKLVHSVTQLWLTLCDPMDCSTPGFSVHHQLTELTHSYPSSWWCHPTISSSVIPFCLPSIFHSIWVFSHESVLHIRWPRYWSLSFSFCPSIAFSGPISFRIDWFDLLAVQKTLKSPLQHHSSKASILQCSAFFIVQLSHPYMASGKTIALTTWTFVGE